MRFVENIEQNISRDFMPRDYFSPLKKIIPIYSIIICLMIASIHFSSLIGGNLIASILCSIFLIIAALATYIRILQTNDLMMANDFQNLLFATAASLGSSFCFYVRLDGTVVYANDGMREIFSNFAPDRSNALDAILEAGVVSSEDRTKLYSAMSRGKRETFVFSIKDKDGSMKDYFLTIEPLQRPSGYFVIFGRPYQPERVAATKLSGEMDQINPLKIESMVNMIPLGIYITNTTGVIEYTNHMLNEMVRFDESAETGKGSLQSLIYHADGFETGEFDLVEFQGVVLLECRNKKLLKAHLQQKIIYGANKQIIGFVGIVNALS